MSNAIPVSEAAATLSEVVRRVREEGEEFLVTVRGEPCARIVPISGEEKVAGGTRRPDLRDVLPHHRNEMWVSRSWAARALGVSRYRVDRMLLDGELRGMVSDDDGCITVAAASVIEAGGDLGL